MGNTKIPSLVLLLSSVLWGASWWPLKTLAQQGVEGLLLIAIAYTVLCALFVPFLYRHFAYIKSHFTLLLAIAVVGGLGSVCFNYALINGHVLRVMALFYLLPVWGVLGGRFILKEPTSPWRWLGVVLAIVGALVLLDVKVLLQQPFNFIDFVALASGLFFAGSILLFRAAEQVPLVVKMNFLFFGCCILSVVFLALVVDHRFQAPSGTSVLWVVAFALGWLLWSNLGSQWAITKLPAGRSSILMVMELVAAAITAVLIGGEVFTFNLMLGGALILSATAIEIMLSLGEAPAG